MSLDIQKSKFLIIALVLVLTIGALFSFSEGFLFHDDYITRNSRHIDSDKLSFVKRLERERGAIDDLTIKNRKYISIDGENQYCIFAFFDPNLPVSSLFDDAYCFRKSDGKYVGIL